MFVDYAVMMAKDGKNVSPIVVGIAGIDESVTRKFLRLSDLSMIIIFQLNPV